MKNIFERIKYELTEYPPNNQSLQNKRGQDKLLPLYSLNLHSTKKIFFI
jgi:hypothetical protein